MQRQLNSGAPNQHLCEGTLMSKTGVLPICVALVALIAPSCGWAVNLQFLKYDPVQYFTEEDWRLASEVFEQAMNGNPDGVLSSWENPESGNSGTITPLETYRNNDGMRCRTATVRNRARHLEDEYTFKFCKGDDGVWKQVQ